MRVLVVFCLFWCVQVWGNELENILKNLSLTPSKQEMLQNAMAEFYAERRAYQQNGYRIRNRLLLDLKNGKKADLKQYEEAFKEVSEEYIKARIAFYCAIAEALGTENMERFLEYLE